MARGFRSPSKVARRLTLTPLVSRGVENWSSFMYHYALGVVPTAPYRLRGGARLRIGRGTDHVPIIEVFLRRDYGEIANDMVIVDLGASIGAFSIYAATSARNVRVYAYEPMPAFFQLLLENVALNHLHESVTCFNLAVAADRSDRELFVAGPGVHFPTLVPGPQQAPTRSTTTRCVDLTTILDSNQLGRLDLLKMDVEGAEYDILYNTSSRTLERIRELRMEYHNLDQQEGNVGALKRFLTSRGYVIAREHATTATHGGLWVARP